MSFYRRRLPHWQPDGASIFLTWRLHGSLPSTCDILNTQPLITEGQRFRAIDRLLDRAHFGPTWLKEPAVAQCVADTLLLAEKEWHLCDLFAWVVMRNHVHVLLRPHKPLREVTRAVKSASAREANGILARRGLPFWQDESYDHWVRNASEFERIVRYIEGNPVNAGLASRVEDWPWSSAAAKGRSETCPTKLSV